MDYKTADVLPIADSEERGHYAGWILVVGQHRDSDALERSNYRTALHDIALADPSGEDYAELRFGHWAVGWVEELAVRPGTAAATVGQHILERLENYAALDDDDYSTLEYEDEHPDYPNVCWSDDPDCPRYCRRPREGKTLRETLRELGRDYTGRYLRYSKRLMPRSANWTTRKGTQPIMHSEPSAS